MDVSLPRLGEGADSGTVASIFVKEGDRVAQDQPILELESEKAVAQIPSPGAGTVVKLHVKDEGCCCQTWSRFGHGRYK